MLRYLFIFLCAIPPAFHGSAQTLDRMTLKSFATAAGHALEIDLDRSEILWRFPNNLEMRFPFEQVNFILFGRERKVDVRLTGDTASLSGIITQFSPERGLQMKVEGKKKLTRIIDTYTRIILSEHEAGDQESTGEAARDTPVQMPVK